VRQGLGLAMGCVAAGLASAMAVFALDRDGVTAHAALSTEAPHEKLTGSLSESQHSEQSPTTLQASADITLAMLHDMRGSVATTDHFVDETDVTRDAWTVELSQDDTPTDEPTETEIADAWSADVTQELSKSQPTPITKAKPAPLVPWKVPPPQLAARPSASLKARLAEISPAAEKRLAEKFAAASAVWPPAEMTLVAIKDEKALELYARPVGGVWKHIHRYPVLAASGASGPKLRKGDMQVPEGVYGISLLNPNSKFHVSMRVDYPNAFDRRMAAKDGRKELGGDIMIHGKNVSKGCLAVGDAAAEELFVLASRTGLPKVKLVVAPTDFRRYGIPDPAAGQPAWVPKLYTEVASAMADYKAPPSTGLLSFFGQ
jgi:hypothetical protein